MSAARSTAAESIACGSRSVGAVIAKRATRGGIGRRAHERATEVPTPVGWRFDARATWPQQSERGERRHSFSWRGQRASKESFSGVVEGENVSRGASRVRRSRGGNLTTRDRALRVPYPSRLLLACARGDATQRLAAPGGSRWTRRERLDVPSSARSGCFGSRSLGSRLCDARAGFLPHTPPTLTQPRVAHPDGSVPFPVYRLES